MEGRLQTSGILSNSRQRSAGSIACTQDGRFGTQAYRCWGKSTVYGLRKTISLAHDRERLTAKVRLAGKCTSTRRDNQPPRPEDFFDESVLEALLPLFGYIFLFSLVAPLVGIALPSIGVVVGVVALAAVTGQVDKLASAYGISPLNSAAAIAGIVFAILAIPFLLKIGVFALAGLFAVNLVSNLIGSEGLSKSNDVDASNAIIDVDYESVDD